MLGATLFSLTIILEYQYCHLNYIIMMKRLFFIMSMLYLLGLFCACSDSYDSNGSVIDNPIKELTGLMKPVKDIEGYKTISIFFESALPAGKQSDCFFVNSNNDECHVINSHDDLCSLYCGEETLPKIDFDHYMLILGQKLMPDINNIILRQELLYNEDGYCQLNIYIPQREGGYTRIQNMYYWALYSKFIVKNINIKIVKEKV